MEVIGRKTWKPTVEETKTMIDMFDNGHTHKEIGDVLGKHRTLISRELNKLGIKKGFTDNEIKIMIDMCEEGYSYSDISKKVNSNSQTVSYKLNKLGYVKKEMTLEEYNRKFPTEENKIIINMNEAGYLVKDIAKEMGKSKSTIRGKLKSMGLKENNPIKICPECGKQFKPPITHAETKKFCTESCKHKALTKKIGISLNSQRKIKAKQNGRYDKDINIYKLIERDGEQCYLCGDAVSFELNCYDPKYPTIEHVLAISNGGTHSWDNIKVACRDCNCRKSSKLLDNFKEVS